jgi:hypothetical protein
VPLEVVGIEDLTFGGDVLSFVVVFDTNEDAPLLDPAGPPAADPAKWTARYGGGTFVASGLTLVDFQRIFVGMEAAGAQAGADELNYSNAPSDIADTLGRSLAAFSGYPL